MSAELGFEQREAGLLAAYAFPSVASVGREHAEPLHSYRGPFQRDRDRIVHSAAFRRLAHKTQVFTGNWGDYHRSRLTHTLEVASVARTLARALRLNEDLVEALALLHDIGHPPFGHAGEDTLNQCLKSHGGFNHNAHALRLVEVLEMRYPSFPGLNLSAEVLEGQRTRAVRGAVNSLRPLLEAQVVDAADSVTYDTHDADDALELGLLRLDELLAVPLWREAAGRVRLRFAALDDQELRRAVLHELIDWQVGDLVAESRRRLAAAGVQSFAAVRAAAPIAGPSVALAEPKAELERFLYRRVYRHPRVLRMRARAQASLREMFDGFCRNPHRLPPRFQARLEAWGLERTVADYLAGMTDRFARRAYVKQFAGQD
ncbi:MAG: deoxyguanosinetriphosphate triphosphohydrolase [Pirellulales bacterium]